MNKIEILAPAGSPEALKTAINHGADAVYLGLQDFNARISADNFTRENIKEYVRYAHTFGTKVYLTVNTLVNDDEMPKLINTVKSAVEAKVDAYLVQDLGIFNVLKNCFTGINLHASTQLGVHNLEGAKVAESLGFTRVVLSREAKLEDIKQIKQNTNLEIEYFVQGALCIAFSGNCYFSGMMQDDSGNRGRCKQYCRMKYTSNQNAENNTEKYLLSARDLCLLKNLQTLIDAGVTSFKIEGRLRREGYVAQAVDSYKNALKTLNNNKMLDIEEEIFRLKKVFSRGDFNTDAYLNPGVPDEVVNKDVQNHLGISIGKVLKIEPFKNLLKVSIKSSHELNEGDGLKFLDKGVQVCSLGVGNVEKQSNNIYVIYTKHKLKVGFDVNLILDNVVETGLVAKIRKLPLSVEIEAFSGKKLQCVLFSGEHKTKFISNVLLEEAKNCPTSKDQIVEQFSKLGDTYFDIEKCDVKCDNIFIPKSVLNNFRREAVEKLVSCIVFENEQRIVAKIDEKTIKNFEKLKIASKHKTDINNVVIFDEKQTRFLVENKKLFENKILMFSPTSFDLTNIKNVLKNFKGQQVGINLPIIANHKDLLVLNKVLEDKNLYVLSNNLYGLSYLKNHQVIAGAGMNVFNDYSISFLNKLGIVGEVVSVEQQFDRIETKQNVFAYTLGFVPLMTFAHCPYKTINETTCKTCTYKSGLTYKDVLGNEFLIRRYILSQCYFQILNSSLINAFSSDFENQCWDLRNFGEDMLKTLKNVIETGKKQKLFKLETSGKLYASVK